MSTYAFRFILESDVAEEHLDLLWKTFQDDVLSSVIAGKPRLSFERKAPSLEAAIRDALHHVRGMGLTVERVELEPLVFDAPAAA